MGEGFTRLSVGYCQNVTPILIQLMISLDLTALQPLVHLARKAKAVVPINYKQQIIDHQKQSHSEMCI